MNKSELILNQDGSIYHLNLLPNDVSQTIILVGDPERVSKVSNNFDSIELKKQKREFITHTGFLNQKRITVISTGIGVGNIDIVLNELDALFNIDFDSKTEKSTKTILNLIRIGTSGSLDLNIKVDDFVISKQAIGFDGMMNFYPEYESSNNWYENFRAEFPFKKILPMMYFSEANKDLMAFFKDIQHLGITGTLPGFYAPQGRKLRLKTLDDSFLDKLNSMGLTNFEMETAAIYAFSKLLGHKAISINAILANRSLGTFSENPKETENKLIKWSLERIMKM